MGNRWWISIAAAAAASCGRPGEQVAADVPRVPEFCTLVLECRVGEVYRLHYVHETEVTDEEAGGGTHMLLCETVVELDLQRVILSTDVRECIQIPQRTGSCRGDLEKYAETTTSSNLATWGRCYVPITTQK